MKFRNTQSGKWVFGQGLQSYCRDTFAIVKDIETYLQLFFGEFFLAPDDGVPWFELLGSKNTDNVVLIIKKAIVRLDGVVSVNDLSVQLLSDRTLIIKYVVDTIFTSSVSGEISI